jgi:hypothetical protein
MMVLKATYGCEEVRVCVALVLKEYLIRKYPIFKKVLLMA